MKASKKKHSIILFSLVPTVLLGAWTAFSQLDESQDLNPHIEVRQEAIVDTKSKNATDTNSSKNDKDDFELFDQLTSGLRSFEELDEEWSSFVGDSAGLKLSNIKLPEHRLTMLLTEVHNLASNPFRIMFVHSFASLSEEDAVTLYSRELDGLEEKNLNARIVAAQSISKTKDQNLNLEKAYRYHFSLSNNFLKRAYDLRAPRGQSEFTPIDEKDFDLVKILISEVAKDEAKSFDSGSYRTELIIGDVPHDIQLTVRQTDIQTFTLDLRVQEVGSLLIRRFGLIYE